MALKSHASGYKTNSSSHTNSTKLWVEIRNCATTLSTPQIQSNTLLYIIHNLPIETVIHWDIQPNLAGYGTHRKNQKLYPHQKAVFVPFTSYP
jgi:hypothetical protein